MAPHYKLHLLQGLLARFDEVHIPGCAVKRTVQLVAIPANQRFQVGMPQPTRRSRAPDAGPSDPSVDHLVVRMHTPQSIGHVNGSMFNLAFMV